MNKFMPSKVKCIEDSHMEFMATSLMQPGDVAVVIPYSGSSKDPVQVAQLAKKAFTVKLGVT